MALAPNEWRGHHNKGCALGGLSRFEESQTALKAALQANLPFPLSSVTFKCDPDWRKARHTCPFAINFLSVYDKCTRDSRVCVQLWWHTQQLSEGVCGEACGGCAECKGAPLAGADREEELGRI